MLKRNERMEKLYREKDLIGKGFSLTEQRKSLEEFKIKVFEEMIRHSTAKFASNKTDIAKPEQEESVLGQQGSNEEPKEKPVEKKENPIYIYYIIVRHKCRFYFYS